MFVNLVIVVYSRIWSSEIDSPRRILSSSCAESNIDIIRKSIPVRNALDTYYLSCICDNSNLDALKLPRFTSILTDVTHVESIDFNFCIIIYWLNRSLIEDILCAPVLSLCVLCVDLDLLAPTILRVVFALFMNPKFDKIRILLDCTYDPYFPLSLS